MKKLMFFPFVALLFMTFISCEKIQFEPNLFDDKKEVTTTKANATVPFHAEYYVDLGVEISPPPLWIVPLIAEGKARHMGKSTWTSVSTIPDFIPTGPPPFDPNFVQTGTMTFTAADGSELVGSYVGLFDGFGGWGDYEIEYGTGRFEGAYTEEGCECTYFWVNNPDGPNYLEFNGTLTNP